MAKKSKLDRAALKEALVARLRQGPITAKEGMQSLGQISQQSFANLIKELSQELGDKIILMGRARNTRYALKRTIENCESPVPIFRIEPDGSAKEIGRLQALEPKGFYFEPNSKLKSAHLQGQHFDDLPFFLDDLRPRGYLGRLIPPQFPQENFPDDISRWSTDQTLSYLSRFAWNTVGNLILGETSFQQYIAKRAKPAKAIAWNTRAQTYAKLAVDVLQIGDPGSSAAGEQPKFLCEVVQKNGKSHPMMVKFSPKEKSLLADRRRDLLVCEHLAHKVLTAHDIPATESSIVEADGRTFLEMLRFDRNSEGGRFGVISLGALDLEFVGAANESWSSIATKLASKEKSLGLDESTLHTIRSLELFGRLIGNSDMHNWNLSFYFRDNKIQELCPAYDMLPMLYAPKDENLVERKFTAPIPKPTDAEIWREIYPIAISYWEEVRQSKQITKPFQKIAKTHLGELSALKSAVDLLPT